MIIGMQVKMMNIKLFWSKEKKREYDQHVLEIGRLNFSPGYNLRDEEIKLLFDLAGTDKFWDEYRAMKKRHDNKRQMQAWNEHLVLIYNKLGWIDKEEANNLLYGYSITSETFPEKMFELMHKEFMREAGESDGVHGSGTDEGEESSE